MIDVLILTAPFTYTLGPSMAPALLKSCVSQQQISAQAWDLSAEFNFENQSNKYYSEITAWMQQPELKISVEAFEWYSKLIDSYATKIIEIFPTWLAISCLTQNSQRFTEDLCYTVRLKSVDKIKIIIGGNGIDIIQFEYGKKWHDLLLDSGLADCVLLGEGDYALTKIIKNNLSGLIIEPQLSNEMLEQLPIPDYSDYNFDLYPKNKRSYWRTDKTQAAGLTFSITASRGCVRDCSFCDVGKIWGRYRFRSGSTVAKEIIELYRRHSVTFFSFTDSLMNGGLKPFYEMNQILASDLPRVINYEGQFIVRSKKDMPERYFKSMYDAGCANVSIGLESGSESVRNHMGKGSTDQDIAYTTDMLIKYGIEQNWNIIAGYPTETDQDWQKTIDLIKYWHPRSNGLLKIDPIGTFLMLQNTPMVNTQMYQDLGINTVNIEGYTEFSWVSKSNTKNTFDVRVNRFIELCELAKSLQMTSEDTDNLNQKIWLAKTQLEWYKNNNAKKIFSMSQN
jgi:hypothetical protein